MYGHLNPRGGGDAIPLLKSQLVVGRRGSCDITLGFPNISGKHCELILSGGYWYIRDLNSSNGIKVNGVRVTERRVDPGMVVSIAKHEYEVVYDPAANGAVGPPPPDVLETNVFSRSLLERAGLQKRDVKKFAGRNEHYEDRTYDITDDSGKAGPPARRRS